MRTLPSVVFLILHANPMRVPDAGPAERHLTATMTVAQSCFDGREFEGVVSVCADEDGVFIDSRLSTETFDVGDVTDCKTERRVPFYPVEGGVESGKPTILPIRRDTCIGRRVKWRIFRLPDPSQSGCLDVTVRGVVRSADAKVMEILATTIRVQP